MIRLNKRMAELGLCSRREADAWITAGWVRVNGARVTLGQTVSTEDVITIDKAAEKAKQRQVTLLLNKPLGYVSGQPEDGHESADVLIRAESHWKEDPAGIRFEPGHARHLAVAGRLDIDSTGLLVLTQDGRIARQIIGEDADVEKEYLVRVHYDDGRTMIVDNVRDRFPAGQLARLRHGLRLDGKPLKPAEVSWQNADQLRFVLREGKKRQIRRMCEQVGLKVVGLKRVRIGQVLLGQLPPGQWRYLNGTERFA